MKCRFWPGTVFGKEIAAGCVAGVQIWKRNSLISILAGTILYMILTQMLSV